MIEITVTAIKHNFNNLPLKKNYCEFCIWTKDWHWERILLGETFLGITIPISECFFKKWILSELVAKFYIRVRENENVSIIINDHDTLHEPAFFTVSSQTLAP